MVEVFREVKRCLHDSGVCFINLGDSYASNPASGGSASSGLNAKRNADGTLHSENKSQGITPVTQWARPDGLKPKDLCGIPWRVVLALQADGWYWRSTIVWHKRSCMPESVTDRPTNSWEPIFLLTKSQRYFYDAEAVKEPGENDGKMSNGFKGRQAGSTEYHPMSGGGGSEAKIYFGRNQRNVWVLGPEPYSEAHFATFPTEIPRRAILAGTSARGCCPKCGAPWERVVETTTTGTPMKHRGTKASFYLDGTHGSKTPKTWNKLGPEIERESRTVGWQPGCSHGLDPVPCTCLDPFGGSGTVGQVALELGRRAILCELNPNYLPLIKKRTEVTPGLQLA